MIRVRITTQSRTPMVPALTTRSATRQISAFSGRQSSRRQGATLSEVLVALLIMAIGVISLASLFPIAVLKTAKASQLTTAADMSYNARTWTSLFPHIIQDPDPTDSNNDGAPFNDVGYLPTAYLFDPLALIPGRPVAMPAAVGLLPRYGGGFNGSAAAADRICSNLDSWTMLHEGSVTSINGARTQVQVNNLNLIQGLQWPGANAMRVHLFYNGGKSSHTRMVTSATAGSATLDLSEDANSNGTLDPGEDQNGNGGLDLHTLPAGMTYETARIESRERRFSWLLTLTSDGFIAGSPTQNVLVKVVVYFGRGFSQEEERIYGTPPPGVTVPVLNLAPGSSAVLQEGSKTFTVTWPAGEQPYLKRGGWILDAQAGNWYQVENYSDPALTGGTSSVVTLVTPIQDSSTLVMFPRGVVEVF